MAFDPRARYFTTIGNYRQACAKHGVSPDLESYRSGHAEGVGSSQQRRGIDPRATTIPTLDTWRIEQPLSECQHFFGQIKSANFGGVRQAIKHIGHTTMLECFGDGFPAVLNQF